MSNEFEPVESPDHTTVFPYHDLTAPTVEDVYRARRRIEGRLPRTPLVRSEPLSAEFDAEVYLKREDTLPTGAFKVRGGLNLVSQLDERFRDTGLIAASTGNHGQSIAYAGRAFDVPVTIVVPEDANPTKVTAMERLEADVRFHGDEFDEAREHAEQLAVEEGFRLVHSANEPALVAGVATAGLEVVEDLPDVDYVFCPVGGGSSASGYCLTAGRLADATVVGAQSAAAPAMHDAWHEGHLEPNERMETFAEGIATRVPFALTSEILGAELDDFRLVDDGAIRRAVRDYFDHETLVAEGASAAALAALREAGDEVRDQTVVLPVSGRNVGVDDYLDIVGRQT